MKSGATQCYSAFAKKKLGTKLGLKNLENAKNKAKFGPEKARKKRNQIVKQIKQFSGIFHVFPVDLAKNL